MHEILLQCFGLSVTVFLWKKACVDCGFQFHADKTPFVPGISIEQTLGPSLTGTQW